MLPLPPHIRSPDLRTAAKLLLAFVGLGMSKVAIELHARPSPVQTRHFGAHRQVNCSVSLSLCLIKVRSSKLWYL